MKPYFPLFVDLSEKEVVVIGAGNIAARRIQTLCGFTENITVIAPEASAVVRELAQGGAVRLLPRSYIEGEISPETYLVLAATDNAGINQAVCRECREKGVLVNVCSDKSLCDFYFPGIAREESLVVGVTAGGTDHGLARRATEGIRQLCKELKQHRPVQDPGSWEDGCGTLNKE